MGYYYNISEDLANFPDAWCYIVIGGRNTGKTYSTLVDTHIMNHEKFVFLKRTMDDVDLLCSGSGRIGQTKQDFGVDLSPFKSVNRDKGTNVQAFSIKKGLGGFWECDGDGTPISLPIGYLMSLSAVQKYKGFDMSECSRLIFDEFIPQPWERVNRKEGEQVMDLYKTIGRDREHRGLKPLKLICLANATNISNPLMNVLEITDKVAEMQVNHQSIFYDDDRGILIHVIRDNEEFMEKEAQSSIYKAMKNTAWGRMALANEFAYDDLSNVRKYNLKGFSCWCRFKYKEHYYYIYRKDGQIVVTDKRSTKYMFDYNLNLENDQKRFWRDVVFDLRCEGMENRISYSSYTLYDLITNYRKFYQI